MSVLDEMFNNVESETYAEGNQENNTSHEEENTDNNKTDANSDTEHGQNNEVKNEPEAQTEQPIQASNPLSEPEKKESIFANEELAEANAYLKRNPGKSFADYQALKAPSDSIDENTLIKSYLSEKEGKTEAAIAYELKRLELKESDSDFDDEFSEEETLENLKLKADRDELIQKAREWRDGYVKEQLTFNADNQENTNVEENTQPAKSIDEFLLDAKRLQEEYTQNYRTRIYEAVGNINEIPLNINGTDVLFVPDEQFKTDMRHGAEDVASIGREFFDENNNITNAASFIKENTLWANPKTRKPLLDFMIKQAVEQDRSSRDKGQRNITLNDKEKHSVEETDNSGGVVDQMLARNKNSF